jgi:hypothetical protein
MKQTKKTLLLTLVLFAFLSSAMAQSTIGKDFWVTFLPNYEHIGGFNFHIPEPHRLELIVTGKHSCSGRVTNPNTQWSMTFEIQPETTTIVSIPIEGNYIEDSHNFADDSDCILNHGLHIVTTDSVTVCAANSLRTECVADASCVLTTQSLGDTYIVQAYPCAQGNEFDFVELSIIAVENNTIVDINLTERSAGNHEANRPFSVTLQAGQCYQIMSAGAYTTRRDFSGSYIKARNGKRIAVFAGNNFGSINYPQGTYSYSNHLYEQMLPVTSWGQKFVVTCPQGSKNSVHITASKDFCEIKRNGVPVDTIHARQTYEYEIPTNSLAELVETSEPAQMYLYSSNPIYSIMTIINPLEQSIKNVTFSTFNPGSTQNRFSYVNIVTKTVFAPFMKLDGNDLSSQFHSVPQNNQYSYARVQIQEGFHSLSNDVGDFTGYVFGMRNNDNIHLNAHGSYAYSIGSMAVNLTTPQIMVDEQYSLGYTNGFWYCVDDTINFSVFANFEISRTEWHFGDNTTGTGTEIAHHYPQVGNYNVSCDVYTFSSQGQDSLVNTISTKIHIQQPTEQDVYATDCDSHYWNGEIYHESGIYTYHGHSLGGCDSIINMHLTLHRSVIIPYDETACNEYEWHDSVYTHTGIYSHDEGQTLFGCDSIAELHLTIKQTPTLNINGFTEVYCSTNLWSGVYYYTVDSTDLEQGPVAWECSNPLWTITPLSNFRCMIVVNTTGSATLTATTTAGCTGSKTIQINADYFDLDRTMEDKVMLFPNPAQSQVTLVAPLLNRVIVFDYLGQRVKNIENTASESIVIDVSDLKAGVYLVEIVTSLGKTSRRLTVIR